MEEIPGQESPRAHVRGHSSFNAPASTPLAFICILTDLAWLCALLPAAYVSLGAPPLFRPDLAAAWLVAGALLVWLQLWGLRGTLGQRLWGVHLVDSRTGSPRRSPWAPFELLRGEAAMRVRRRPTAGARILAACMTAGLMTALAYLTAQTLHHPAAAVDSKPRRIGAFAPRVPPVEHDSHLREWIALPFFYLMGAWPNRFGGYPVLYTMPYEKGPPDRFAGHVVARLKMPDTRLILEGPKTPADVLNREELRECFTVRMNESGCMKLRFTALERHLREMRSISPTRWQTSWFEVENPSLPARERPRGIHVQATNGEISEDRYIIVTPNGAHQAVILRRTENEEGEAARRLIENAVASQRVQSELGPGRALINHRLSETKMDELRNIEDTLQFFSKLAEIQAMLVAKISVDPREQATYYHLGGTALMLIKNAAETRTRRTEILSSGVAHLLDEWTAAAKPLVHAAYKYSQDVAPDHPNTTRLQNLWIEAQKY